MIWLMLLLLALIIFWLVYTHSPYNDLKIYLTYGAKGSGKSLTQAKDALALFRSYWRTEKRYPNLRRRIYFGNQKFSPEIEAKELGVHLFYWENAKQLRWCPRPKCWRGERQHYVHDADIAHDEIGKDLPANSWSDTPKWFRQIFSHLRKRGNRYFANTQVFEDIDIAFRRQIDYAFLIGKVIGSPDITATAPAPKWTWGVIVKRRFDPKILEWTRDPNKREEKQDVQASWFSFPRLIFIRKKYVNAYDTTDEIDPYKPDTLEHVELWCENPDCEKHGINKVGEGAKPKVEHYKI